MKIVLTIDGREHTWEMAGGKTLSCMLDGVAFEAEAVEFVPKMYSILLGGKSYWARAEPAPPAAERSANGEVACRVSVDGETYLISNRDPRRWSRIRSAVVREGPQKITAPMPGKVIRVLVAEGEKIETGQGLIVVEAMKMQNEIKCQAAGTIQKVNVREGQAVIAGETLFIIE